MDVLLRCKNCGRVLRLDARTAEWPNCACGDADWRLQLVAPERVERAADPDAWKDTYDEWKTRTP
jgi:hypothetical protein